MLTRLQLTTCAASIVIVASLAAEQGQPAQAGQTGDGQSFRFKTGIELINVTATVTDESGRFVSGLRKEDFRIYQDDQLQPVTHFSNDRVPVSLGIALDTSGSMGGEKILAARAALNRFLFQLLDPNDEAFLYRFDSRPELIEGWTTDRRRITDEMARIQPHGGTAMYDAVAEAVPLAQSGANRKKALLLISDGNDTSSRMDIASLKPLIRETEVLVYAIGIDSQTTDYGYVPSGGQRGRQPRPMPFPIPGGGTPPMTPPRTPGYPPAPPPRGTSRTGTDERVNIAALRDITDDSGGRTEIIRSPADLAPATASIADELSKQYYLGYAATGQKDGRWHTIRVEVRGGRYTVRARKGYVAS
jgi:Ca-activated chloride channel homolog